MKLSLSGRLFESRGAYSLSLEEFLRFAKEAGYAGVEIRYPQLPLETPASKRADVTKQLTDLGLTWVFGTVEGIADDRLFDRALRTLDNNLSCGCLMTRFTVSKPEHLPWARRFADEAAKRGAKLVMQLHANTLVDNVPHVVETFAALDRPNIGLSYEANHLVFDGNPDYAAAVAPLARYIVAASVQNFKAVPEGTPDSFKVNNVTWVRALPGDPEAIDFPAVFKALKAIGFDGFVTVMTDAIPGLDSRELSKRYCEFLKELV
jgi:sugar phosphate isomerase/epimerase